MPDRQVLDAVPHSRHFLVNDDVTGLAVAVKPEDVGRMWVDVLGDKYFFLHLVRLADEVEDAAQVGQFEFLLLQNVERRIVVILVYFL